MWRNSLLHVFLLSELSRSFEIVKQLFRTCFIYTTLFPKNQAAYQEFEKAMISSTGLQSFQID